MAKRKLTRTGPSCTHQLLGDVEQDGVRYIEIADAHLFFGATGWDLEDDPPADEPTDDPVDIPADDTDTPTPGHEDIQ